MPDTTSDERASTPAGATTMAGESLPRSKSDGSEALVERNVTRRPASMTTAGQLSALRKMETPACLLRER